VLLAPGEEIFDDVPPSYVSPFPDLDTALDKKYQAFLSSADAEGRTLSDQFAVQQAGQAFTAIQAICNKEKAVVVGDLLNDWLPKVAWMGKGTTGSIPLGLFAEVPWGRLKDLAPDELVKVMGSAALTVAMTTMAAIPVYGQIASALVGAGKLMYRLFESKAGAATKRLVLPWETYSREKDVDWVTTVKDSIFRSTNWTSLFAPPFEREPWRVALHGTDKDPKGLIFMPTDGSGNPAWAKGLGCMPGTFRVAGQVQGVPPQSQEAALIRSMTRPKGVTPRSVPIPWRQGLTMCGDYLPSLAQLGAATWQQVQATGNPDMFKVSPAALGSAWEAFFENLYATAQQAMYEAGGTIGQVVGYDSYQAANLVSQLVEPYLCYRLRDDGPEPYAGPWELGVPEGYRPHNFFHAKIFERGPVEKAQQNSCLFVETDTARKSPFWPYGGRPRQHPKLRPGSYEPATTPATTKVPPGYRCVSYPDRELMLAQWASPFEAFIRPQLDALAKRQWDCLATTLVCAYVRPVGYDKLPIYDAFDKTGKGVDGTGPAFLQKRCLEMREQLLKSEARFLVNLKDVRDIDPKFEAELRASGVTNTWQQLSAAKFKLRATVLPDAQAAPEPPPTSGGVAFGDLVGGRRPPRPASGGGAGLLLGLAGAGLAIGGGVALMNKSRGRRVRR